MAEWRGDDVAALNVVLSGYMLYIIHHCATGKLHVKKL